MYLGESDIPTYAGAEGDALVTQRLTHQPALSPTCGHCF